MNDIVKEAQEELEGWKVDCWGLKEFYLAGTHREIVEGLLERIQELEGQDWFTRAITAEAGVEVLSGRVRDLEWYLEQARQERDTALERVRVLEEAPNA